MHEDQGDDVVFDETTGIEIEKQETAIYFSSIVDVKCAKHVFGRVLEVEKAVVTLESLINL